MPTRTSKHSDSEASALRELRKGDGQKNQQISGNGFGNPQRMDDNTDRPSDTMQGRTVISRNKANDDQSRTRQGRTRNQA